MMFFIAFYHVLTRLSWPSEEKKVCWRTKRGQKEEKGEEEEGVKNGSEEGKVCALIRKKEEEVPDPPKWQIDGQNGWNEWWFGRKWSDSPRIFVSLLFSDLIFVFYYLNIVISGPLLQFNFLPRTSSQPLALRIIVAAEDSAMSRCRTRIIIIIIIIFFVPRSLGNSVAKKVNN